MLTALPLVSGPTLCFYAIEQGPPFAAEAAHGTLLALIPIGAYAVAYTRTSRHRAWPAALLAAGIAWSLAAAVLYAWPLPVVGGVVALAASCAAAHWLLPRDAGADGPGRQPRWDLPVRMAAAAGLVLALTSAAAWLGPRLSGFLASFPLATTILVAFAHAQRGPAAVSRFFRGFLPVLPMFGVFCALLTVALGRIPIAAAFALSLFVQVLLQLAILWWMRRAPLSTMRRAAVR